MILELINTYTYFTLKRTLANHVDQIQKQKSGSLHYLLAILEKYE